MKCFYSLWAIVTGSVESFTWTGTKCKICTASGKCVHQILVAWLNPLQKATSINKTKKTYFLRRSNCLRSVYLISVPAQLVFFFWSYILLGLALQWAWLLGELIILLELRYLSNEWFCKIIFWAILIVFVGTILTRRLFGEFQRLFRSFSLSILFAILLCVSPWHSFNYNYTFSQLKG